MILFVLHGCMRSIDYAVWINVKFWLPSLAGSQGSAVSIATGYELYG
jgi:hypothetical protein